MAGYRISGPKRKNKKLKGGSHLKQEDQKKGNSKMGAQYRSEVKDCGRVQHNRLDLLDLLSNINWNTESTQIASVTMYTEQQNKREKCCFSCKFFLIK